MTDIKERCESLRAELSAFAVHDADPGLVPTLEEHLSDCAACRARLDADRETLAALAAFDCASEPTASVSRGRWLRSGWTRGVAAAVIVFSLLSAFGARVEAGEGRLALAFGRSDAGLTRAAQRPAGIDREALRQDLSILATRLDAVLAERDDRTERRMSALLHSLEERLLDDRRVTAEALRLQSALAQRRFEVVEECLLELATLTASVYPKEK
jgi:hypothetical protein